MTEKIWKLLRLASFGSPFALGACLPFPHRETRQFGAIFHVTDQAHQPIAGASVFVYEGSVISSALYKQARVTTDRGGEATILRRREWRMLIVLIPDAQAPSVYGWCAEASGYAPLSRRVEDAADLTIDAPLLPSGTEAHCPPMLFSSP